MRPEHGSFCIGWNLSTRLKAPGALYVHAERLMVRSLWRDYVFPRANIEGLRVLRILLWRVIRLRHSVLGYARFIAFRPYHFADVYWNLIDAGFAFDGTHQGGVDAFDKYR